MRDRSRILFRLPAVFALVCALGGGLTSPAAAQAPALGAVEKAPAPGAVEKAPEQDQTMAISPIVGTITTIRTRAEDTLLDIARRYDVGYVELMAANQGIDPWVPPAGAQVVIPGAHILPQAPHKGLVVNLAEMRTYYFPPTGGVYTFPIGIGREGWSTPLGSTRIVEKIVHPAWYPPASIRKEKPDLPKVVPAGPDNPLGDFAMRLGWPGYLMHGTNLPDGVGRRVSHGCMRYYPEDISRLFSMVKVGTPVTVVNQPIKFAWVDNALYMEVHPTVDQIGELEVSDRLTPVAMASVAPILQAAGDQADRLDWPTIWYALTYRPGIPMRITLPQHQASGAEPPTS